MSSAQANRPGIFFGSPSGPAALSFQGGMLCVQPPLQRSPKMFTFGSNNTCSGGFERILNDGIGFPPPFPGGFDAGPGGTSYLQAWYRDPALADGFDTALSDAIEVAFLP